MESFMAFCCQASAHRPLKGLAEIELQGLYHRNIRYNNMNLFVFRSGVSISPQRHCGL
jgi:hypothetical protein